MLWAKQSRGPDKMLGQDVKGVFGLRGCVCVRLHCHLCQLVRIGEEFDLSSESGQKLTLSRHEIVMNPTLNNQRVVFQICLFNMTDESPNQSSTQINRARE